jgi:endonuclease YncB( thermonuclease family)
LELDNASSRGKIARMKIIVGLAALALCALAPAVAFADPCTSELPRRAGDTFTGTVRYVGDGDSLCIGAADNPSTWIEVRLGDFDAPELRSADGRRSKQFLEQVALGRLAQCRAVRGRSGRVIVYDRVIAVCSVGGRSIGDLLRSVGAPTGGN